jgi:hypothetical protein
MALAVTGRRRAGADRGMLMLGNIAGSFDLATILERGDVIQASPLWYPAGADPDPAGLLHQIGAVPVPFLAAPRDGRADAGERLSPFRDDGEGGRVPAGAAVAGAGGHARMVLHRWWPPPGWSRWCWAR